MNRRQFLDRTGEGAAAAAIGYFATSTATAADQPTGRSLANDDVTVAVVGVHGRGRSLLATFAELPKVVVKYVCDIDESVLGQRTEQTFGKAARKPEMIGDFRKALDDKTVDAIVLGTPDHWHAIPTILACQAGKDVYVEKPDGHNLIEGRTMVAAQVKHRRVVQLGTQLRSSRHLASAIDYIKKGNLGRAMIAKSWESTKQGNIGRPADQDKPPAGVDYDTWLGPAPKRPFNPVRFHGNWRWFFDYGTGDLGNDGVHRLDLARWALETAVMAKGGKPLGVPKSVSTGGGKYYFDDAQEWPDTLLATFDYETSVLMYELRVWAPYKLDEESEGVSVYGDQGYIIIGNGRWRAFTAGGKPAAEDKSPYNDLGHAQNFIDCMRTRAKPAADLETVGHPSSILCHLGNAAWRAARTLRFDPATYTFPGDKDAEQFLTRSEYRKPWTLPKLAEV